MIVFHLEVQGSFWAALMGFDAVLHRVSVMGLAVAAVEQDLEDVAASF